MTNKPLWSGRFREPIDPDFKSLNDSLSFDRELFVEDIEGSMAWANALAAAGVLDPSEARKIVEALGTIEAPAPDETAPDETDEDIHAYVERKLTDEVGPLGGKLHTGRSRNDQVATDFRLYVKKASNEALQSTLALANALATRGEAEAGTVMPGYTHLKQAEPVTFGHWSLAYAEMLARDADRLKSAIARNDECPLGSGALSGTPLPIDREALAKNLGFARPTANSLDAVSDRDFVLDYFTSVASLMTHLSRLAEDLILFSSDEFAYVVLPDSLSTGSSRMPQKKNPDLLELTRGYAARVIGDLTAMLTLMKGLPLAYNKDLQLDKEPLFRTRRTLSLLLPSLTKLIEKMELNRDRMREAASADLLLATELADALAARGIPFREAHEIVGRRFSGSEGQDEGVTPQDLEAMNADRAVSRRNAIGGTSPERVKEAAKKLKDKLK